MAGRRKRGTRRPDKPAADASAEAPAPPRTEPSAGHITAPAQPRRRTRLRRLFLLASAAVVAIMVVGIAAALRYRTELAVALLNSIAEPFAVAIRDVTLEGTSGAIAHDVVVRIPGQTEPIARIARVRILASPRRLVSRQLTSLEVESAEIRIDEAFFAAFEDRSRVGGGDATTSGGASPALSITRASLRGARVEIAHRDFPTVRFETDYEGTDLAVTGESGVAAVVGGRQRIAVRDLTVEAPESSTAPGVRLMGAASIEANLASLSGNDVHVDRLVVASPEFLLAPPLVEFARSLLALNSDGPAHVGAAPGESHPPMAAAGGRSVVPAKAAATLPNVRIDELLVSGGLAEASGLAEAAVPVAADGGSDELALRLPDARASFAITGKNLAWDTAAGSASGRATLDVENATIEDLGGAERLSVTLELGPQWIIAASVRAVAPVLETSAAALREAFALSLPASAVRGEAEAGSGGIGISDQQISSDGGGDGMRVELRSASVVDARFALSGFSPFRLVAGNGNLELRDIAWSPSRDPLLVTSSSDQEADLRGMIIDLEGDGASVDRPTVRADRVTVRVVPDRLIGSGRLDALSAEGMEIHLARASLLTLLQQGDLEGPAREGRLPDPENAPSEDLEPLRAALDRFAIADLRVESAPFLVEPVAELGIPAIAGALAVETRETPDGPRQTATLTNVQVGTRIGSRDDTATGRVPSSFATAQEIRAVFNPETFRQSRSIEDLTFVGAHLVAGRDLMEWTDSASGTTSTQAGPDAPESAGTALTQATSSPDEAPSSPPPASPDSATAAPPDPEVPTTPTPTPTEPEDEIPGSTNGWTIDRLSLDRSTATLQDLVPGLPPVAFALDTTLDAVPLTREGILASRRLQRVEVSNASIRSQLEPLYSVADLRSIFLEFTLAGLLEQKIESIEIVSPVLYVGEHLFWYIDFYRKFESAAAAGSATDRPASPPDHALFAAAGSEALAFAAAASPLAGPPDLRASRGWDIGMITAHNGRLVLAPKGLPMPNLPQLPFSGRTRIVDSRLAFSVDPTEVTLEESAPLLQLSIPEGDYPLRAFNLDWNLDLLGLSGEIAFNLPIESRANNLVQTLRAAEVWFEQVAGKDVFLSVTYDQFGIYARFGGAAFGGYANGEFNLYLDQDYSWDGWVSGTDIALDPLTDALTPEYCSMTGRADVQLVANGNLDSLNALRAEGFFVTRAGGGAIDILALGDLAASLPDDLDPIAEALAEAGLTAIQHFTYDTARIDFEAVGREGELLLDLQGSTGRRTVDITVRDRRYRPPASQPEIVAPPADGSPAPATPQDRDTTDQPEQ